MSGIMVTCWLGKEGKTVREMYNLLPEYAEILKGEDSGSTLRKGTDHGEKSDAEEGKEEESEQEVSLEESIAREVAELNKPKAGNMFKSIETSTDCVIFMKTKDVDPVAIVHRMLTDIAETKVKKSRFAQRLIPFSQTCFAGMKEIEKMAQELTAPHFHGNQKTFAIVARIRHCDRVTREEVIKSVADIVGTEHKVDLANGELVILIEVCKNICGMSVVTDYFKLKRYNAQEIFEDKGNTTNL